MTELLTEAEYKLITSICEVWGGFLDVVGGGISREDDLREVCAHIHALQNMVLAQAAARAYQDKYRLMGGLVGD